MELFPNNCKKRKDLMILTIHFYKNLLILILFYIGLNKFNYNNEFNIICDIGIKNDFNINTIKKIHKEIKVKLQNQINIPPNNIIDY